MVYWFILVPYIGRIGSRMARFIKRCSYPGIQWLEWKAPSVFGVGLRARLGFALAYIGSKIWIIVCQKR